MKNYELMVIFSPVVTEEEFKQLQEKYIGFIKEGQGEIVHSNPLGLKSLAYPIKKKTLGLYWVIEYKAPTHLNPKLKIQFSREENIFRYLITVLDKHAIAYNHKKRNKTVTAQEKISAEESVS